MKIETKEIETDKFNDVSESIVILPQNYLYDDEYKYHSTTCSFYKYARNKIGIDYLTEPELLIEQRSGEWFGPILLFTFTALSNNPQLVAITCGVIANYVTDFFKGQKIPNVNLKVLYKENKKSKVTEISYQGPLEGLDKLKESIEKIAKKGTINE